MGAHDSDDPRDTHDEHPRRDAFREPHGVDLEDEDTKKIIIRRVSKLERAEERRTGSLTVITYLLGLCLLGGASFFAWLTLTLTGVQGEVHSLAADVHARLEGQQHDIDRLEQKIDH